MSTRYPVVIFFLLHAACSDYSITLPLGLDVAIARAVQVTQGQSGTTPVLVTRSDGYTNGVPLEASGLPSGVTAAFDPTYIVAGTGNATSTLTLTAATNAATGTFQYTVTAVSSRSTHPTATGTITVIAASNARQP